MYDGEARGIARVEIDPGPIVSHIVPIEQVGRALELAENREDGVIKVSLSF